MSSSSSASPPGVLSTHYSLYCRKRSPIGASAALIMQWYNAQYRVCWDVDDVGVDSPALYDPHTMETVNGLDIVAYLLNKLDTEGKRIYKEGTLEAEKVQIRIERMLERVQAGDPIRFAFDLEGYLREKGSCRVVGRTTSLADFLFFSISFAMFVPFQRGRGRLFYRTAAWYGAWARDPRTLDAMASVGWNRRDFAFNDLLEGGSW